MNKSFGLVVFKETTNIGDDIQSYSAIRFLPKIDYYIEREKLNEFISDRGEKVNVIMNGWYLHDITSLPPSPYINPYFISTHLTDHLYNECPEYLTGEFLEYLKKYSPIGCRDLVVSKYLDENGIDNYWSGCMTLTLNKFEGLEKEDYICAVDLTDEELAHLKVTTDKEIKVITHKIDKEKNETLSYDERMHNVEELLKVYQKAALVVTNRLHTSLPNLALETPVLLIYNEENIDEKNRLGVYLDLLNHTTSKDFIAGGKDDDIINIKPNSTKYLEVRKKIIKNIDDFIKNKTVEYKEDIESIKYYQDYFIKQKHYLVEILKLQKEKDTKIRDEWMKKEYEDREHKLIKQQEKEKKELSKKSSEEILKIKQEYEQKIEQIKNEYETKYKNLEYEKNRLENKYKLREEVYQKELNIVIDNYSNKCNNKVKENYYKLKGKFKNFLRRCKRFSIRVLKKVVKGGK